MLPQPSLSPDGRLLAVACDDPGLRVFDVSTRKLRTRYYPFCGYGADFSPNQQWLAVAGTEKTVYVFPIPSATDTKMKTRIERLREKFEDDSFEVRELAMKDLAAIGIAAEGELHRALSSPSAEVRWRARELLRRLSSRDVAIRLTGHEDDPSCVCFSPDGQLIASGDTSGHVEVWRVGSWREVASL